MSVCFRLLVPLHGATLFLATSLFKYFKCESVLPNPSGPLSEVVPSEDIKAANKEVKEVIQNTEAGTHCSDTNKSAGATRGAYERFTAEEKVQIGRRAAQHGVAATVRFCSKNSMDAS